MDQADQRAAEQYFPLPEGVRLDGCWLVWEGQVNINDLLSNRAGRLIRILRPDALRYIPPSSDDYAGIAGLISDAA